LPLLYAMWHGNKNQAAMIREAILEGNGMENLQAILATMESTGALLYTKQQAIKASQQAIDALHPLPASQYKQALIELAGMSVERVA
jgi:octaprenyl-diphosphate synthase